MDFENLSTEELSALVEENRAAAREVAAMESPTIEQVEQGHQAWDTAEAAQARIDQINAEAQAHADRTESLRGRVEASDETTEEASEEEVAEAAEEVEEPAAEEETPAEEETETASGETQEANTEEGAVAQGRVQELSSKVDRPQGPSTAKSRITITAAANVPNYTTGTELDMDSVGDALVERMKTFSPPSGDGSFENLQHFGVAKFKMDFDEKLTVKRGDDPMEVLNFASQESRLDGGSLVAAGGWCAPSETLYDLCVTGESLDGILSIPEINVDRGGINFTKGPDFAEIFAAVGFCQTEAEAEAGTPKTCFEVPCPDFEEVRLDACGLCVKAPILTNAAYPELIRRWLSGSMVAHAHKMNAKVIGEIVTAAGTPLAVNDYGSGAQNTLATLELLADQQRQRLAMRFDETLEVVVPFWVRGMLRSDLALRQGGVEEAITDAAIAREFAARHVNVQYVYDWQPLTQAATTQGYPATFTALVYPAGSFVKGTKDVISLNAVYDAASLETNIYTALFFEQGILVANVCNDAVAVTIPVCTAGRVGAADIVECGLAV